MNASHAEPEPRVDTDHFDEFTDDIRATLDVLLERIQELETVYLEELRSMRAQLNRLQQHIDGQSQ